MGRCITLYISKIKNQNIKYRPVIKLHPKDDLDKFKYINDKYCELHPIVLGSECDPINCIDAVDVVTGMSSIMLIEAYVLGKKVISIQPNLRISDPLIISKMNLIEKLIDKKNIASICFENINQDYLGIFNFKFQVEKFMNFLLDIK